MVDNDIDDMSALKLSSEIEICVRAYVRERYISRRFSTSPQQKIRDRKAKITK